MNQRSLFVLVKYGKLDRLISLLETGKLYLSSVETLRASGDKKQDNHQIDHLEGATRYFSKGPVDLTLTPTVGNGIPIKTKALNLTYAVKYDLVPGNICSFYSVTDEDFNSGKFRPIDRKMVEFGSHAIIITNVGEFLQRIEKALPAPNWSGLKYGHVEYFDESDFVGDLDLFKKRSAYSYQQEFRVLIESNQLTPAMLDLGSLHDIAVVVSSDATLKLKLKYDSSLNGVRLDFNSKNVEAGNGGFKKKFLLYRLIMKFRDWILIVMSRKK
ncbi:MAG: hypothetical protein V4635_09445 [Bacteroidota bacterium]